jgi:hypothetical protein
MAEQNYDTTTMAQLEREIQKHYCDIHFRSWHWLWWAIKDNPAKLLIAETMLRKALFDSKNKVSLNLKYWYRVWYGVDINDDGSSKRDPDCISAKLGIS